MGSQLIPSPLDDQATQLLSDLAWLKNEEKLWRAREFIISLVAHSAARQSRKFKATADRMAAMFVDPEFMQLCPNVVRVLQIASQDTVTGNTIRYWRREAELPDVATIGLKEWLTAREVTALARAGLPDLPTSLHAVERWMNDAALASPHLVRKT